MIKTAIVIPARYASTRFPGKPLAKILGKSMLERTWHIAKAVDGIDTVIIATDDQRIAEHATAFGATVQLTASHWRNGSERSLEALKLLKLSPDVVINLQGDAVLTPPFVIDTLLKVFNKESNSKFKLATPCTQLTKLEYIKMLDERKTGTPHGTLVTFDLNGRALYFSRALIPFPHSSALFNNSLTEKSSSCAVEKNEYFAVYRHIGLYAFRYSALQEYVNLKPTMLETIEGLEQLRALEHGWSIKVVPVDYQKRTHWSVDHTHDIAIVEKIIQKEGELVEHN